MTDTWTRRGTLAALAASAALPALPAAAFPASPAAADAGLAALREIAMAAAAGPAQAALGTAFGAGRAPAVLEEALLARLGPLADETGCRAALLARGRADVAAGDMVDPLSFPVMRTEALLLALGTSLQAAAVA